MNEKLACYIIGISLGTGVLLILVLLDNPACSEDGECPVNPIAECDETTEKCKFTWWFVLIIVIVAMLFIGGVVYSCVMDMIEWLKFK